MYAAILSTVRARADGICIVDLDRNLLRMPLLFDEAQGALVADPVPMMPDKERSKLSEQLAEAVGDVYQPGDKVGHLNI